MRVLREAKEMDVTERTIQRDLKDIEIGGFPLYKAAPGVYKFIEGFSLKKMNLTQAEAALLLVMQNVISSLGKPIGFTVASLSTAACPPRKGCAKSDFVFVSHLAGYRRG